MFRYYLWLLLLVSPLTHAHGGISVQAMVMIFVIWPAIISIIYGCIVFLLRWKHWFNYLWVTVISSLISFLTLLLWGISVFAFIGAFQMSYFSAHNGILVALFMVLVINLTVVIWSFNIPKKQYRQFGFDKKMGLDKTDSINEILGIKDRK